MSADRLSAVCLGLLLISVVGTRLLLGLRILVGLRLVVFAVLLLALVLLASGVVVLVGRLRLLLLGLLRQLLFMRIDVIRRWMEILLVDDPLAHWRVVVIRMHVRIVVLVRVQLLRTLLIVVTVITAVVILAILLSDLLLVVLLALLTLLLSHELLVMVEGGLLLLGLRLSGCSCVRRLHLRLSRRRHVLLEVPILVHGHEEILGGDRIERASTRIESRRQAAVLALAL
jgi:hypothetical protein